MVMVLLLRSSNTEQAGGLRHFTTMVVIAELGAVGIGLVVGVGGLRNGWCWLLVPGGSRAMGRWVRSGQLFGRLGDHSGQDVDK